MGEQIISDVKDVFIEKLKAKEWMSNAAINLAVEKVHNIGQKIGYPEEVSAAVGICELRR
jgi:endothelin-converting enzyme